MNKNHTPILEAYVDKALTAWDESGELPSAEKLREIAVSLSMDSESSEAADELALELTAQAREALAQEDDEAAEALLRRAVVLSPVRLQPHYLLAELYARYYRRFRNNDQRLQALELAAHAHALSPEHTPSFEILEELGAVNRKDTISWKHAAMIVLFLVLLSGSMSVCVRYTLVPTVPDGATEQVRQHFEEQGPPERR